MVPLAAWGVATLAGQHSAASLADAGSFSQPALSLHAQTASLAPRLQKIAPHAFLMEKSVRLAAPKPAPRLVKKTPDDPFTKITAGTSREKLLAAFARAGMTISGSISGETVEVAAASPVAARFLSAAIPAPHADRFGAQPEQIEATLEPFSTLTLGHTGVNAELAYAAVEPGSDHQVQLALASVANDPFGMDADESSDGEEATPEIALLPPEKPQAASLPSKPKTIEPEPDTGKPARSAKPKPDAKPEPQQALAYARPDKPAVGAFKNLFNTPKAGRGVAIYDISASVVHMPDGTRLEAHSGIGKMADNPRFVHVKMNGPTPPNTYKLSMREKRFHGVEAVRMTPIGGQTMHGRDGILAHSYLLRGGRAESHGCVAFKDYPRFLKAFKQGKVTHIVVVPSMSNMPKVRMASAGRGA